MQNMRQCLNFYVRFTFADALFNLLLEYDQLKLKVGKVTRTTVAAAYYDDRNDVSASIKQTVQIAMRLPAYVICITQIERIALRGD